ncbi:MAG: translation initiation factor IF-2 subunit beta [Candidatus Woesearchaeota archaeon]
MNTYEKLLERAQKNLPKDIIKKERFEIPLVEGRIEGSKTVVTNFSQIASAFHRDPTHLLKYLQRELAAPGSIDKQRLVLGRKINSSLINEKVKKYAEEFVICKACKRPDTKIIKEGRVFILKCTACGAKNTIKSKI